MFCNSCNYCNQCNQCNYVTTGLCVGAIKYVTGHVTAATLRKEKSSWIQSTSYRERQRLQKGAVRAKSSHVRVA